MGGKIVTRRFSAEGTTCNSCLEIIKRQALKLEGVTSVDFDLETESGSVTYDANKTDLDKILYKIEEKGYNCFILDSKHVHSAKSSSPKNALGWIFGIIGLLIVGYFILHLFEGVSLPTISPTMGYGLLFVVGLLTGFHCIAMCGGFVVGYTARDAQEGRKSHWSHIMYGGGKLVSYTVIGAAFGLLGSIIAFTPQLRGFAGIIAGIFLLLFGLRMLNIFPSLRTFGIKSPDFVSKFGGKSSKSPLVVGLLNGLMIACGPLQAIYIMAAGTGSMIEGAKLLFVFGLGTLPVMLGFGYFATFVSTKLTSKILKASGVIVIILGLLMLNNGLALTGSGYDMNSLVKGVQYANVQAAASSPTATNSLPPENTAVQNDGYQEIKMDVVNNGWTPDTFVLKRGVPVHWVINGIEVLSCNGGIQVPKYDLKFQIQAGLQTIQFTPSENGVVPWTCWMGMLHGTFIVVDDIAKVDSTQVASAASAQSAGGSCNMGSGGGGCGCGMMG